MTHIIKPLNNFGFLLYNLRKSFLSKIKIDCFQDQFPKFFEWLKESRLPFSDKGDLRISIKSERTFASTEHLVYEPIEDFQGGNFVVGVGCERGTDPEIMHRLVINTLEENCISPESVALVVSIDIKADEPAIHELAKNLSKICNLDGFLIGGASLDVDQFHSIYNALKGE